MRNRSLVRRRAAVVITAMCLSLPLSAALAGVASADTGDHGKVTAPGQLRKAAEAPAVIGPVAPAFVGPVATTTSDAPTSLSSPQPLSGADMNAGGANNDGDCGAYCSTRDGAASLNGNGGGAATGKPCAGCVGKADNKNPPGQAPNGTDANAGYECDRNSGVGKTNPAHTGCRKTPPPPPCVVTATNTCTPPCVVTATNTCPPPCVVTATNTCTPPCVVTATNTCTLTGGGGGPGTMGPPSVTPPVGPPIRGRTTTPATLTGGPGGPGAPGTPALPFTGSNSALLLQLALGLLLVGGGLSLLGSAPTLARRLS